MRRLTVVALLLTALFFVVARSFASQAITNDITEDRGADWSLSYIWTTGDVSNGITPTPVDLTGATAAFSIRTSPDPSTTPLFTEACTLGGTSGTLAFGMTAAQSLGVPSGDYPYDVFVTFPSGQVYKFLVGLAHLR